MQVEKTPLKDCYLIKPEIYRDKRGIFLETYHRKRLAEQTGIDCEFVQDNQSVSKLGVLRGLHFQKGEHAQTKIVRVIHGKVLDVVVDVRQDSPLLGRALRLFWTMRTCTSLYVPKGFAHGFITLSEISVFAYKCDDYYRPGSESGIIYNDPTLAIDWNFPEEDMIISEKDQKQPNI